MKIKSIILCLVISAFTIISCNNAKESKPADETPNDIHTAPPILDKEWKLVEVNGKAIPAVADSIRHAHMILLSADNRVNGNGGCNSFSGGYTLSEGNGIKFSQVASTKMACANMEDESQFFNALEMADNYTLSHDTLSLNKAKMAPLAKFVAMQ